MKTNISALKKYLGNISLVSEISEDIFVPTEWRHLVNLSNKDKIAFIISLWKNHYNKELSILLEVFRNYLVSVDLIENNKICSILYRFKNSQGEHIHYVGHPPLLPYQTPESISGFPWPDKFLNFYTKIHNGWYEVESHALGLMPIEETFLLSKNEWGILEDISIDFSLDRTYAFRGILGSKTLNLW